MEKKKLAERINEKVNMVDFLFKLGYKGHRSGKNYFFNSPFREERTPSFSVHATKNLWKDWGTGNAGTFIDFGEQKYGSVSEFVKELLKHYPRLYEDDQPAQMNTVKTQSKDKDQKDEPEIKIKTVRSLFSYPLLKYLNERRIPQSVADQFCKEIHYELKAKEFYAIGFKNDSGGYALRNRHMKQACAPNDVSFIDNGSKTLAVFEGFFDFLSYMVLLHNQGEGKHNFLILNSTSFFEKSLPKMQEHSKVHLFLDNDKTGTDWTALAQGILGDKIVDRRFLYKDYNDLNEMHQSFGLKEKPRLNHKL